MKILVCISRVPDTAAKINIGADRKYIDENGVKFIINPYDEFAIEEALQLREKGIAESVTVLTLGSDANNDVLRTALAMGVDNAVLINGDYKKDSFYIAKNIANYAKEFGAGLILLGKQSVDYDSLQLPSILAEMLDMPSVSVVSKLTIDGTKVVCERDIEGGKEVVETTAPCIISTQKGLNNPRYPKLPDIMKAKKKPIETIEAIDADSKVTIIEMEIPRRERLGKMFTDSDADISEIVKLLHEEAKII